MYQELQSLDIPIKALQLLSAQIIANEVSGDPLGYIDGALLISYLGAHSNRSTLVQRIKDQTFSIGEAIGDNPSLFVPLQYLDGYPATPEGTPFWERLDNEREDFYDIFKQYRNSTHEQMLERSEPLEQAIHGRSIALVAERRNLRRSDVITLSRLYHWYSRAHYYDKYQKEQLERLRAAQVKYMEGEHARAAQTLFNTMNSWILNHVDELTPKSALEWFDTAVKLERLSRGLPPDRQPDDQDQARTDRRAWVQVNVNNHESDTSTNGTNGTNGNRDDGLRARLQTILNTLQPTIDITPEDKSGGDQQ